jgi:uncharacterized phage protein gp47/JayE
VAEEETLILDYTARDFDAIRSMLVGIARGKFPEWRTVGESNDFGTLLLELYAYMGDVSNYYIDRVSSEAFLGTAIRRQSVLYIAEMLGYRALGQLSAIVELSFLLAADYDLPEGTDRLQIPAGTVVETREDAFDQTIYFETDYDIFIEPGQTVSVAATEGRTVFNEFLGTSKGQPNAFFSLQNPDVITRTIEVKSLEGGTPATSPQYINWTELSTVVAARPTQSVFSVWSDEEGFSNVTFGDNAAGRIPPIGAEIYAKYRYGAGGAANQITPNSLTVINGASGLPVEALRVTNTTNPFGGANPESIESMRFSIPRASRIRNRAVTLKDFEALAVQVPGVAKAMAYGQIYSAVNVRVAPVGGEVSSLLMEEIKSDVVDYLADKILIGSKIFVEDVLWEDVYLTVDLYVLPGFSKESVESAAISAITTLFSFDRLDFGQRVTVGEIYRAVMQLEGVDWMDIQSLNVDGPSVSKVSNLDPGRDSILRLHPAGEDPEADPYGLVVNTSGGVA